MSSTILYKFRSGTTFEALPLPGSAARLFDVKKAIVTAKKLDQGSIEFDLSVRNATTNEEYTDESMLLPRGTRIVVQRLPAAKGHGFLARMARNQYGGGPGAAGQHGMAPPAVGTPGGFYDIDSRARDEDDEFVSTTAADNNEEKELAALRAATEAASSSSGLSRGGMRPAAPGNFRSGGPAGSGPPTGGPPRHQGNFAPRQRPNADPELRDQEKQLQPKKRATGIPRTFLSLTAPPATDGDAEGEGGNMPLLQPNTIGFKELVNRGGGQSENALSSKKNLEYAIKVTGTTVPEYLQCSICHDVVRDAMILPWDPEGRTTCDSCIRDALTQGGFRCPLTGMEGVSPDDILANHALRKAAVQFVIGVMDKMDEIEKQVDDDTGNGVDDMGATISLLEGDGTDKGVVLSRRAALAEKKKKAEDDPFGGGDDDPFGGDVFAVEVDEPKEEEPVSKNDGAVEATDKPVEVPKVEKVPVKEEANETDQARQSSPKPAPVITAPREPPRQQTSGRATDNRQDALSPRSTTDSHQSSGGRREPNRRRGPPVGYAMGPAGGAVGGPRTGNDNGSYNSGGTGNQEGYRDRSYRGRGRADQGGRYQGGRGYGGRNGGGRGDHGNGSVDAPSQDDVSACCRLQSWLPLPVACFPA
jgi:hypothetical protein